jgi:hypothetical protein
MSNRFTSKNPSTPQGKRRRLRRMINYKLIIYLLFKKCPQLEPFHSEFHLAALN